jgi:F-type H+-transporting ATPase subunit epsilon
MAEKGKIQVRLVTPDRILLDEMVASVEVPSKSGYMEVLPGSAPVLARIGAGMLRLHGGESGEKSFVITRGIAEVLPQRVTILANTVETPGKIDLAEVKETERRGEELWQSAEDDAMVFQDANDLMMEAQVLTDLAEQRH